MGKKFKEILKGFVQDYFTKDSTDINHEEYSRYHDTLSKIKYRLKRTRGGVKKTLEEELEITRNELNEKQEAKKKKNLELMAFLEKICYTPFVQSYLKQIGDFKIYDFGIFRRSLYLRPDGIYIGNLKFVSKCGFTSRTVFSRFGAGWADGDTGGGSSWSYDLGQLVKNEKEFKKTVSNKVTDIRRKVKLPRP